MEVIAAAGGEPAAEPPAGGEPAAEPPAGREPAGGELAGGQPAGGEQKWPHYSVIGKLSLRDQVTMEKYSKERAKHNNTALRAVHAKEREEGKTLADEVLCKAIALAGKKAGAAATEVLREGTSDYVRFAEECVSMGTKMLKHARDMRTVAASYPSTNRPGLPRGPSSGSRPSSTQVACLESS